MNLVLLRFELGHLAEGEGPASTPFLLRLDTTPSRSIGLGTASPFLSADKNMLRRSNPSHEARRRFAPLRLLAKLVGGGGGIRTLDTVLPV